MFESSIREASGRRYQSAAAKLVDNDEVRFDAAVLRDWRAVAEQEALYQVGRTVPWREAAVQIIDKWVNLAHAEKAGITRELTAQGYDLRWSTANEESERVDLQGWEPVLLDQADGTKARLKIHDHPGGSGFRPVSAVVTSMRHEHRNRAVPKGR